MEFDEYEYLEKTVEEGDGSNRKKEESGNDRSYRKREGERHEEEHGDDERGSSRSKKSRGDGEENGAGRRDREKERHRSSREKDKERERDKVREGSRDKESPRERRSSKERDRSERDKTRDRERREREKERERRDRERRSSSRSRREEREREVVERGSRRHKDKKDEPEADPERDQRTVFAYQMPLKATERDVYDFFSKAGKVRDVRLIMDRNSRRSKGVGYIEFYDVMSVPMAIALSGQMFLGQPVMVKPSEAEKNLAQSNTSTGGVGGNGPVDRKLYVGNLHFNMTDLQLRQLFEPFGPVELVQLPLDLETGQCKGYGFIQFAQLEHSKAALSLNGTVEIAGRTIKVSSVSDHVAGQDSNPKSADFDDDDGGGLSLNAQSRALLMQKLDRTGMVTSNMGLLGVPARNGTALQQAGMNPGFRASVLPTTAIPSFVAEPVGQPSECLLLKNMFDPATEEEPDFDVEIEEDVKEECSKYGRVNHIYVDKNSAGLVYLRFESVQAAVTAQREMHMRWFAQKMISATFMPPHEYEAKAKA
uniref:RNA-binding protein 39 n=1 Tax=Noccaea caerulescens TaxID=107243 RepID=A0A1J3JPF3_NOCCA